MIKKKIIHQNKSTNNMEKTTQSPKSQYIQISFSHTKENNIKENFLFSLSALLHTERTRVICNFPFVLVLKSPWLISPPFIRTSVGQKQKI
jgi:hypothetical protein